MTSCPSHRALLHPTRRLRRRGLALAVVAALVAAGCSSGSDSKAEATLTGLAITPATVGLAVGQAQQLTATGTYSDGSTQNLTASATWVSSATTTATVTNGGLVTAVQPGAARITASAGGKTATRDVTVSPATVTLTSISVGPSPAAVDVGFTLQLVVTGTFSDLSTQDLTAEATFVSSVTSVATVTSPGGLVTGVAPGQATITASARGKTASRQVTVSAVSVPVDAQVVFWNGYGTGVTFRDFGGAANNVTVDSTETFHGRSSIKLDVVASGAGSYSGGAWIAAAARDLSAYDALTFWAKATSASSVDVTGFGNDAGAGVGLSFATERAAVPLTTAWQKFTIPIPDPAVLTSVGGLFHLADGPKGYTIHLADVIFEHLGLAAGAAAVNLNGATPSVAVGGTTAVDPAQSRAVYTVAGDPEGTVTLRPVASRFFTFHSADTDLVTVAADGTITGVAPGGPVNVTATLRGGAVTGQYAVTVNANAAWPAELPPIPPEPVGTGVYALYSSRSPGGYAGTASDQSATVGTWRASWSAGAGGEPYTITSTAGTAAPRRYVFTSGASYVGVEFIGTTATGVHDVDVAGLGLTTLHLDVWTPDDASELRVQLVDFGADGAFGGAGPNADTNRTFAITPSSSPALATGAWLSYDLRLATAFPGLEGAHHVAQLLLVAPNGGTVFVDNLYFYDGGPAPIPVPEVLPPVPPTPVTTTLSLYSSVTGGYGGTAHDGSARVDTWRTGWSTAAGGDPVPVTSTAGSAAPRRYVFTHATGDVVGIEFVGSAGGSEIDAAGLGLTALHLDVWTPDNASNFQVKLVDFGADAGWDPPGTADDSEGIATLTAGSSPPLATGRWISYDLPLATAFPGLQNLRNLAQLLFIAPDGGTMYVDNVYFH